MLDAYGILGVLRLNLGELVKASLSLLPGESCFHHKAKPCHYQQIKNDILRSRDAPGYEETKGLKTDSKNEQTLRSRWKGS